MQIRDRQQSLLRPVDDASRIGVKCGTRDGERAV
jgi:hypothetical protein